MPVSALCESAHENHADLQRVVRGALLGTVWRYLRCAPLRLLPRSDSSLTQHIGLVAPQQRLEQGRLEMALYGDSVEGLK